MPKLKTRKTVAKRINVTASGKLKRRHAQTSHLRAKEDSSTKGRKERTANISKSDAGRLRKQLPYS